MLFRSAGRTTPIIAATAFAVQGDKEKCLEAGMSGYVVKPLASHDLLMAVAQHSASQDDDKTSDDSPVTSESTGAETVLDVDAALVRLGNNQALFDKLAVTFLDDTPPKLADMAEHIATGNMVEVLRLAHRLNNSAGMIQAVEMAGVAQALEMAVRDERLAEVPELFDRLRQESESAMTALGKLLEA